MSLSLKVCHFPAKKLDTKMGRALVVLVPRQRIANLPILVDHANINKCEYVCIVPYNNKKATEESIWNDIDNDKKDLVFLDTCYYASKHQRITRY